MWNRWLRVRRRARGAGQGAGPCEGAGPGRAERARGGSARLTLYDLDRGEWARVKAVHGGKNGHGIRQRLLDMGITTGTEIRVERHAPLGDPMEIVVKDYRLALRLAEARHIEVERIASPRQS